MSTSLTVQDGPAPIAEIKCNINAIQHVLRDVMKIDVHYGKIPGTPKPTLFKPGSELILATFRIAVEPVVTDLSEPGVARFRVEARGLSASGRYLGSGVGEASSDEEKYRWRAAVCKEEWEETPEHERRKKWKKGNSGPYCVEQVKTCAADIANTVLKMAKKRAQIDMTLTVTAASDCFNQDLEDLPAEFHQAEATPKPPIPHVQPRSAAQEPKAAPAAPEQAQADCISEKQAARLFAIARGKGWAPDQMKVVLADLLHVASTREIPKAEYDAICKYFEATTPPQGVALEFGEER